ncbi:MAG TPA: hypothetical protein VHK69_17290, partial [Chitinophagaceae bacterium]|nr:hypothetical protein [Chitinophagaceae bacterium]
MRKLLNISLLAGILSFPVLFSGCSEKENVPDSSVGNVLTLFKLDNRNNDADLTSNDTIPSQAGVSGKFIPVNGSAGARAGLDSIRLQLFTTDDVLINTVTITNFFRPEYHVINTQLLIPPAHRGKVYKVVVTVKDKAGATVESESFYGVDVVSCDPLPPCVVPNQITVLVETPA